MPTGITGFTSKIKDVQRTNRFRIEIAGKDGGNPLSEKLSMLCIGCNFPSVSYSTNDNHFHEDGKNAIAWTMPYDVVYGEANLQFIVDDALEIRNYFHGWQMEVFDEVNGFGYMDEYTRIVKVFALNRNNQDVATYTLNNAYPKTMGEITFSASETNAPATMSVQIMFL